MDSLVICVILPQKFYHFFKEIFYFISDDNKITIKGWVLNNIVYDRPNSEKNKQETKWKIKNKLK